MHCLYSQVAEDYGGPRKEFFSICLKAIKERYFDDGFVDHKAEVYHTIGVIMGKLSFPERQHDHAFGLVSIHKVGL